MATKLLPLDIKAEVVLNYMRSHYTCTFDLCGSHKRNAYRDILKMEVDDEEKVCNVLVDRNGLYDILPEGLFHSIDRFENIPANEYHERFAEELEKEEIEESNARSFFKPYDTFLMELSCMVNDEEQRRYADNAVIADIICDTMPDVYRNNRFVLNTMPFVPMCSKIRGNKALLTFMLRKVFGDEGLLLTAGAITTSLHDSSPRYNCCLDDTANPQDDFYLGNDYSEDILTYILHYWNEDECGTQFLDFVAQIETFEAFISDYFMGIEERVRFDISTDDLPVRLSDEAHYNYLNHNTNL